MKDEVCEEVFDEKCVNFDVNECQVTENEECEEVVKTECVPATKSVLDLNIDKYDDYSSSSYIVSIITDHLSCQIIKHYNKMINYYCKIPTQQLFSAST